MRTLWPNLDNEDGLETVLEVPLPEEMFASTTRNPWRTIKSWLVKRPRSSRPSSDFARRAAEIQLLLGVIGAPFIPFPISEPHTVHHHTIKACSIERSMASYIVQQYIAAAGGQHALNSIQSMCVIGKVKMAASEIVAADDFNATSKFNTTMKNMKGAGELGGFVLWQKRPHLWALELMLSGFKINGGCDGKVAWRQTPWHHRGASRGPPRPLRRSLQGLDPQSTADLFSNSICTGEKTINGEDCFVLKLEAEAPTQRSVETMKHTIWGCFSQKTGLLVQLEDSHSLRIKSSHGNDVIWETKMESLIQDYRTIDGVNIAHGGRTTVSSLRFGDDAENHTRTRMEEVWSIEEVDFNVKGLSMDCFLAPAELKKEGQECGGIADCDGDNYGRLRYKALDNSTRICASRSGRKVVAVDEEDLELEVCDSDDDEL